MAFQKTWKRIISILLVFVLLLTPGLQVSAEELLIPEESTGSPVQEDSRRRFALSEKQNRIKHRLGRET